MGGQANKNRVHVAMQVTSLYTGTFIQKSVSLPKINERKHFLGQTPTANPIMNLEILFTAIAVV